MSPLSNRHLFGGAAAACAVCCAAPLVGLLGMAGLAATAVTLAFAGVVFAAVVGLATVATVLMRRARTRQATCAVELPAGAISVELSPTRVGESE